eukprot:TRINITY_DN4396_c0_g2_i4.p1 TRINITY_DN4396_c0_g2~~TRINITY_DN4396_c0_g2_i4.p1  ORF type:complete len:233 (+),score=68.50 TRINITY_DN4396_c0_g2_i4:59-757(+)
MLRPSGLVLAVCMAALAAASDDDASDDFGDVFELTDATFEGRTQAATGATTGHWFVMFHAPWCGWCKKLKPDFEAMARDLEGEVVFGKVDCTANYLTCSRFEVKGFPTLYMLVQGKSYKYQGPRTQEALTAFATGGFRDSEGSVIDPEPNIVVQYLRMFLVEVKTLAAEESWLLFLVVFGGVLAGVTAVMLLMYCFTGPAPDPAMTRRVVQNVAKKQTAADQKKAAAEKKKN